MPNPFDPRAALLARHAQHVVLIHFPIALFIAAVLLDLAAEWTRRRSLNEAAYYNFSLAAISAVPALLTGVLAWQLQLEGQKLKGALLQHFILACVSSVLIWMAWWVHFRTRRSEARALPPYRFVLETLGLAVVALTGHLGGFLSGVNGAG